MTVRRAALALTYLLGACGAEPDAPECWFDLTVARVTGEVFFVRDCSRADHGLFRIERDRQLHTEIGSDLWLSRVAVDALGGQVIATNGRNRNLVRVDPDSGEIADESAPWGTTIGELGVTPDGHAVWAALWEGRTRGVALFDTIDLDHHALIRIAGDPVALDLDETGRQLVVVPTAEANGVVINSATLNPSVTFETTGALDVVTLPGPPGLVAVLEDRAKRIILRDPTTGGLMAELPTGEGPRQLAVSVDGTTLVVTERDTDLLRVFDVATATQRAVLDVGGGPEAVAITNDGMVIVGLTRGRAVVGIDLETGETKERYE